jgi:hypothetical protein
MAQEKVAWSQSMNRRVYFFPCTCHRTCTTPLFHQLLNCAFRSNTGNRILFHKSLLSTCWSLYEHTSSQLKYTPPVNTAWLPSSMHTNYATKQKRRGKSPGIPTARGATLSCDYACCCRCYNWGGATFSCATKTSENVTSSKINGGVWTCHQQSR